MKRKVMVLLVVFSILFTASFSMHVSADGVKSPSVYRVMYRGDGSHSYLIEILGGVYDVNVTGSVSLVDDTESIKLHEGQMALPLGIFSVVSSGSYTLSVNGYFDKVFVSKEVNIPGNTSYDYSFNTEDGVVYAYVSGSNVAVSLKNSEGDVVASSSGENSYALLTYMASAGHYTLSISGEGDVHYTVGYTPAGEYQVKPWGVYKTKVVCVASCGLDGDTIRVKINGKDAKIRLIGVNTPEIVHGDKPAQCYGNEARAFTDSHLNGHWIYLRFGNEIYDPYSRYLAYVWLTYPELYAPDSGYMWNAVLAREGYARVLSLMPNISYSWLFNKLVYDAKRAHKGLWGACPNE